MMRGSFANGFWGVMAAMTLCGAHVAVWAQEGEEEVRSWDYLNIQHAVDADFETPHTDWATPYAGGAVRAVFFTPWAQGSTRAREVVELLQRFDVDGHAVYLMGSRLVGDGRPDWYGGDPEAGTNRVKAFFDAGQDVYFANELAMDTLPAWIRDRLQAAVRNGAGLAIVGDDAAAFSDAEPVDTPAGVPGGTFYTMGDGRIAVLPSRETLQFELGWETTFDYQAAAQGRAMLWAANRLPDATLEFRLPDNVLAGAETPGLTLTHSRLPVNTTLDVTVRRWDGNRLPVVLQPAEGDGSVDLMLPPLRAGDHVLECRALQGDAVVTWAVAPFNVTADRGIADVSLDRDWAEINEAVTCRVALDGQPVDGDRIVARLVDEGGRILMQQDGGAVDGATFAFDVPAWAPMLMRAEAVLVNGDREIAYDYAYIKVAQRKHDQFNFVMWNVASGDLAPYGIESLARHGVSVVLQGGPPPLALAASGLSYIPYAASFRASSHTTTAMLDPKTGLLKTGCVHNPAGMRETVARVVDGALEARELGVFAYSLGDENAVRASCLGDYCLEAYRNYLQDVHGGIAALNFSWDTQYVSFDEIALLRDGDLPAADAPEWFRRYFAERQLLHRTDNEGAEGEALDRQVAMGNINDGMHALQTGNFPRWYDRQAFQNDTYVAWCKQFQEAFLQIDPQARTGFEGTDSFTIRKLTTRSRQGGDIDAFVREMDYYGSYEGPANEVMRSIAPNGFPMGSWIGYTPDVEELLFKYWQQVADRMNTIQWWRWDNLDGYNGYLAPNLAPFPATRELIDDTQVVREGIGTLIMNSTMHDDGIAMLYSMPSTYIAHFDENDTYGLYKRDHARWHEILHDGGLQFRYITDRLLRRGEADLSQYKALILPLAFAMTRDEADRIREYVDQGGTVIADVRPALYDGRCKPLEQGLLNDVFGIEQTGNLPARDIDRMFVDGDIGEAHVAMRWGNWHGKDIYPRMYVDPNVQLTTGTGLGEAYFIHFWTGLKAPVCVVNEFGKGRAILLNFNIYAAPADGFVRDLLATVGVEPPIRVLDADGDPVRGVEVSRWQNGDVDLVMLLGRERREVTVELPDSRHVYDVKHARDPGETDTFTTVIEPNRASVFALLTAAGSPPQLTVSGEAQPGSVMTATLAPNGRAGKTPVVITAALPGGAEAPWVKQAVLLGDAPVEVSLPIAHNDPAGEWHVWATDRLTHQSTVYTFAVP